MASSHAFIAPACADTHHSEFMKSEGKHIDNSQRINLCTRVTDGVNHLLKHLPKRELINNINGSVARVMLNAEPLRIPSNTNVERNEKATVQHYPAFVVSIWLHVRHPGASCALCYSEWFG